MLYELTFMNNSNKKNAEKFLFKSRNINKAHEF